jgi:hypothetical protein
MATVVGTATLDFGSTPTDSASITVTGLSGLTIGTHKEAFVQSDDSTVDNSAGDHRLLGYWGRFTCEYVSTTDMIINCDLLIGEAKGTFVVHYVTA